MKLKKEIPSITAFNAKINDFFFKKTLILPTSLLLMFLLILKNQIPNDSNLLKKSWL